MLHLTYHDKLDISVSLITLADLIWLLCDSYHSFKSYHLVVGVLLTIGLILSIRWTCTLIRRHHRKYIKRHTRVIEEPVTHHSEK